MEMADYLGPEIFSESKVDSWWGQSQGQLNVLHGLAEEHLLESVTPAKALSKRPLPVIHIVAISLLIAIVGVAFLYMGDDEQAPLPTVAVKPAPASSVATVASSSIELASTQTPVQPLMQSLPQPQQPNQQVQQASTQQTQIANASPPVVQEAPPVAQPVTSAPVVEPVVNEIAKEEVVPLAQLPTAPPKPASQAQSVSASNPAKPAQEVAAPSAKVATPASVTTKPEPVAAKPASKPTQQTSDSAQERNILSWKPSEYTIQLVGVSNQKAALDFIAAQPNKSELLLFKSKRAGKDWFVVITGRFANSAQARQAIKALPAAQRDAGPWPRDAKTIQSEIKTAM